MAASSSTFYGSWPDTRTKGRIALDSDRARELLKREHERVDNELAGLRTGRGEGELSKVDQHNADAGSEMFDAELDQSMIERLQQELGAIERAEKRLEDGTYGLSVESGEPIPDARLEAMPFAERTASEQARFAGRQRG
jgi:RNA polymerase-binding transcription factor